MASVIRVYSTLTNATEYCEWTQGSTNELPRKVKRVLINGGAGRAQKRTLVTPLGVATVVTDDQLAFLETLPLFKDHVKDGFICVRRSNADPDKVAADMQSRDGCAPLVDADFEANGETVPKVNGAEPPVSEITRKPRFKPAVKTGFE